MNPTGTEPNNPESNDTEPSNTADTAPTGTRMARLRDPVLIAAAATLALWAAAAVFDPAFVSWSRIVTLLVLSSFLGVIAIGQTIVIIAGGEGIDLSVGATATLAAIVASRVMDGTDANLLAGVALALAAAAVVGLLNGLGVVFFRVPPLVMTLAMIAVVYGFIRLYTGGQPAGSAAPALRTLVRGDTIAGIPGVLWLWLALSILVIWLLRRSAYGWRLYAVGGNTTTAYLSGVNVTAMKLSAYVLSASFAAVGGLLLLGYSETVFLRLADPYMLSSVAAAVIGGTALIGGVGGYLGTIVGAVLLTILDAFLRVLQLGDGGTDAFRQIIFGLVLLTVLSAYGRQARLRQ